MSVLNYTKLDAASSAKTIEALSQLLADMQVFYTNLRGFHWNVRGHLFYRLHAYFEGVYNAYATHIDDIAERVLQLGGTPDPHFSTYLKVAKIKEQCPKCVDELGMAKNVLETYGYLLQEERAILSKLPADDVATNEMLTSLVLEQEKAIWMLDAMLQN